MQLSSEVVHEGSFLTLHRDKVVKPDGVGTGFYEHISVDDAVRVVALDDHGQRGPNRRCCRRAYGLVRRDRWYPKSRTAASDCTFVHLVVENRCVPTRRRPGERAVLITIDTKVDSYIKALARLRAAYGVPAGELASECGLSDDDLGDGWTERTLLGVIERAGPAARAVLRFIAENGPAVPAVDVRRHLASHPEHALNAHQFSGVITNLRGAARQRRGAADPVLFPGFDSQRRYSLEPSVARGVLAAFEVFDVRTGRTAGGTSAR